MVDAAFLTLCVLSWGGSARRLHVELIDGEKQASSVSNYIWTYLYSFCFFFFKASINSSNLRKRNILRNYKTYRIKGRSKVSSKHNN